MHPLVRPPGPEVLGEAVRDVSTECGDVALVGAQATGPAQDRGGVECGDVADGHVGESISEYRGNRQGGGTAESLEADLRDDGVADVRGEQDLIAAHRIADESRDVGVIQTAAVAGVAEVVDHGRAEAGHDQRPRL